MKGGVYRWRNTLNGKVYIGSTDSFRHRKKMHLYDLRRGIHHSRHLQHAWDKYGESSFVFEIVEVCEPAALIEREQYWLDRCQSYDRGSGYNMSPTAGSLRGYKHSDETKRKRRVTNKEAWARHPEVRAAHGAKVAAAKNTPEFRSKMTTYWASPEGLARKAALAERNRRLWTGRPHSEESKQRLSKILKGRKQSPELIEKRIAPLRGKKQSPEAVAKRTASLKGRRRLGLMTPDVKAKISAGLKRMHQENPDIRRKLSEAGRKRRATEETKKKMRESQRRSWAERKRCKGPGTSGMVSEEARKRMSESQKKRHAAD